MLASESDPGIYETLAKSLEGKQISKDQATEFLILILY
jgi:hypothetical protein